MTGYGINQPEPTPVREPQAGSLVPISKVGVQLPAGAAVIVLSFILRRFGIELDPETAAALATLVGFGAGYVVPSPRVI